VSLGVALVPEGRRLFPSLTVEENLRVAAVKNRRGRWNVQSVLEAFPLLQPRRKMPAATLSGGEQQAVAIGRALLFDREVILMDEPTAAISVSKVADVLRLVKQLKEYGKTVIIVSHRLEDILEVADRIVVFYQGTARYVVRNEGLSISDVVHMMFGSESHGARAADVPPASVELRGERA